MTNIAEPVADMKTAVAQLHDEAMGGWSLVRLVQHIDQHRDLLGMDGTVALYETWLRQAGAQPDACIAHYNLAVLHQQVGRFAEAEQHYLCVLRQRELPQARYNLGLLLEQAGREQEALSQWRYMLQLPAALHATVEIAVLHALARVSRRLGLTTILRDYLKRLLELEPGQASVTAELEQLQAATDLNVLEQPVSNVLTAAQDASALVVYVVAVCYNEAAILPFFLDHYINLVGAATVVLHDGGSTDGSAEIAARYPQVEFIVTKSEKLDDRALMRTRNEEWKQYRSQCDWMIVCDVDEFLYHPQLRTKLAECKRHGITLPMVEGFEMLSKTHPQFSSGHFIWQDIQTGTPNPRYYNKNLVFDPAIDINYTLGCHGCLPTGPVKRSDGFIFKNLHYRNLSYEHVIEKSRRSAARLSDWNKQTNAGFHYQINAQMSRADYNRQFIESSNVLLPSQRPSLRREAFEYLQQTLLMADAEPRIVELGVAGCFGRGGDSGSTEFFAWFVHNFGGHLTSIEVDVRLVRHARRELQARSLFGSRVQFSDSIEDCGSVDVLFIGCEDYMGDDKDLHECARNALHQFTALEPLLSERALVALDGASTLEGLNSKHALLAAYLKGRGYTIRKSGYTTIFGKPESGAH